MDAHNGQRMREGLRRLQRTRDLTPSPAPKGTPLGPETFGLPDDAAIVAAYRKLNDLDRPLLMNEAEEIQVSPRTLLGAAADLLLLAILVFVLGASMTGLLVGLAAIGGFALYSALLHRDRITRGEASLFSSLIAIGPFSSWALKTAFAEWTRDNRVPDLVVDTGSLAVIEPVARYLAGPILSEARTLAALAPDQAAAVAAARAEGRRDELREQARRETDPVWRRAAQEQAERLDAQARLLREQHAAGLAARDRILADARELETYLDRLTERRRLLEEMGSARLPLPDGIEAATGEEVRYRLGALANSLRAQESLARSEIAAELEMNDLEREIG